MLVAASYKSENAHQDYVNNSSKSLYAIMTQDFFVVRDFNFRDIAWCSNTAHSETPKVFLDCVTDNFLCQMLETPSRDKYINDLLLTGNKSIVHNVKVMVKFGTTHHNIIKPDIQLFTATVITTTMKV